ncbi:hypothetical protein D3C81_1899160 [compost metagenome]
MWSHITQAFLAVLLVLSIVTFKEIHLRITFKSKNMCTDTIQEPSIVGDYHSTATEILQTFL